MFLNESNSPQIKPLRVTNMVGVRVFYSALFAADIKVFLCVLFLNKTVTPSALVGYEILIK